MIQDGSTAMHLAAARGHVEMLVYLIKKFKFDDMMQMNNVYE